MHGTLSVSASRTPAWWRKAPRRTPRSATILQGVTESKLLVVDDQLYARLSQLEHSVALLFVIEIPPDQRGF